MSKRKKRHKKERDTIENKDVFNNNPFGINPNQLMGLLGGNFDFNQIGKFISSMNNDGMNLNNFNLNNNQGNKGQFDFKAIQDIMSNLSLENSNNDISEPINTNDINNAEVDDIEEDENEEIIEDDDFIEEDENIQMLIAIKSIVDNKKANFIDRIIEEYSKGSFK